jgi:hypothetical protein
MSYYEILLSHDFTLTWRLKSMLTPFEIISMARLEAFIRSCCAKAIRNAITSLSEKIAMAFLITINFLFSLQHHACYCPCKVGTRRQSADTIFSRKQNWRIVRSSDISRERILAVGDP